MIKVIIADDHQIVLDGIRSLLDKEKEISCKAEVLNGVELLNQLDKEKVDVAVIDIDMPRMNGIETTIEIKKRYPDIKVLILSMHNDNEFITRLIEIGASGYILKNKGKEELVNAIKKIASGGKYLGEEVVLTMMEGLQKAKTNPVNNKVPLTKREREVLELIVDGLTTPQIAKKLYIAQCTVETHRRNLIDKIGVANSKALIKHAIENGYLK